MTICHYMEGWLAHLTPVLDRGLCWDCWAYSSLEVLLGSFLQLVESTPCQTPAPWFQDPQGTGFSDFPFLLCFSQLSVDLFGATVLWN
jgi:hypothetical protein